MDIYILMKAIQKGDSLDLKCLGAFPSSRAAREAMQKDYDATRNEKDFDRDAPDRLACTAWIVADDDTFTMWSVQHTTLALGQAAERPKNGRTGRLSLKTDDVHRGDRLHKFRVRAAREQSFTANVEAHDAAEAEIVAENFCEAMGSERWDALAGHVHKTFEADPRDDKGDE